jgi:uncharacterized protein (TIGR01777 family)
VRIVITGGSGQVGRILARHFHGRGVDVAVIARHPVPAPWRTVAWDGLHAAGWSKELEGADVVVNLAGRSVNCRYNQANRREIMESRVVTTQLIGKAIARAANPPKLWMNASTATIYRHAADRALDVMDVMDVADEVDGEIGGGEADLPSAWRFSYDVAISWERAFFESQTPHTRKIAMRSAIVMSPDRGGAFETLLNLVRAGLGGAAGSGRQFVSWIHDVDFVAAIEYLIAHQDLDGPINLSSPQPLPNRDFMAGLRRAYGARIALPATNWMLEVGAFFLQTETELVLKSRRVVPRRLLEAGFEFRFPEWGGAAADLVHRWRAGTD